MTIPRLDPRVDLLFVYGSLMRGQPSDGYLAGLPSAEGTTRGRLYRVPAGYPALVPDPGGLEITGEVVRFEDPGLLRVLDLFEAVPEGLYRRERLPVRVRGRELSAWAYVIGPHEARRRGYRLLQCTDWRLVAPRPRADRGSGRP